MQTSNQITESEREAIRLADMMQDRDVLIDWYRGELNRVERLANRSSAEVRNTLSWVLPWLRGVIKGEIPPVVPKAPPPRATRAMHIVGAIPPPRRKKLTLKKAA